MLILTRRVGESLMVGDQITVTVLGVKGNQVRVLASMRRGMWRYTGRKSTTASRTTNPTRPRQE